MTRALVIYESMFGNTQRIAEAIAEGLETEAVEVGAAPSRVPEDVELVVAGGPTHAFGMSRESTREDAAKHGPLVSRTGVREWLEGLEKPSHRVQVATFDTHMDHPAVIARMGSAAHPLERRLRRLGMERAVRPEHFWVQDMTGPLREGEIERARQWGAQLAGSPAPLVRE
jgi:Flavodoxin domain